MVTPSAKAGSVTGALFLTLSAASFLVGVPRGLAQDGSPPPDDAGGRPVLLSTGDCDEPGESLATLSDLTRFDGDVVGQEDAVAAESSYTNVAILPEEIQAEDYVVYAASSADDDASIVCGEIGGPLSPNGTLIVGLRERNDSGFSGIAYLSPGEDGASTDVSVFVARGLGGDTTGSSAGEADDGPGSASPVAAARAAARVGAVDDTVEVSLVEWSVDLPTEIESGRIAFEVTNDGTIRHDFRIVGEGIDDGLSANLLPGETGTLEVDLEAGTYDVYCPIGNHRNEGMETVVTVG